MTNLLQDLKYATRTFLKTPGFTFVAVLTLALGIGANTAMFSVIESVLLRPLPYVSPDQLVLLWGDSLERNNHREQVSFTDVEDWRRSNTTFEDIGAFAHWSAVLNNGQSSQRVPAIQVSDAFFRVLRARPALGRLFTPEDQIDGRDFVVVISDQLWRERFGADPNAIGRTVHINAMAYTIVGVLPPDFAPLPRNLVNGVTGIYRPCAEAYDPSKRDNRHFRAIGRLRDPKQLSLAQSQISAVAAQLAKADPKQNGGYGVRVTTLREDVVGGVRPALLLLYAGVVFVLLIACANISNLLLTRFAGREREIAVRSALGASQSRIVRQLLTESLLLSVIGGTVGLLFGTWLVAAMQTFLSRSFPILTGLVVDWRVFLFTAIVTLLVGALFGLAPALHDTRHGIASALKSGALASIGGARSRLRSGLVVAEVSLALVLLSCAGLMLRTIQQLRNVDPGFEVQKVVSTEITLPWVRYGRTNASLRFYDDLLARVKSLPEVESAAAVSTLPFADFDTTGIEIEGKPVTVGNRIQSDRYIVSADYLQTMKIALKSGRLLDEHDDSTSMPVIMVNEHFAHQMWPGENALGKRVRMPEGEQMGPWRTVVGIVADVKQYALDQPATLQFYVPYHQVPSNYMTLVVRGGFDTSSLMQSIRSEVRNLDADAAASDPELLSQIVADSIQIRKLTMMMLTGFAALALTLAAVGIYGVLSFSVSSRTREIGVRMALGASERNVLRMVLRQGLSLIVAGAAVGLLLTLIAGKLVTTLLFGVRAYDPIVLGEFTVLLVAVATVACYLPAKRATNIDPMEALRQD
ncbi:MAG TPA: ABC transporter permease [Terriglobales bacterium]|nr:ABC transporter permease [Terriglobales bacterium]